MKSYDNQGRLVSEINTSVTSDGHVITTNSVHYSPTGRQVFQDISVRDSQGKVSVTHIINGKLLP